MTMGQCEDGVSQYLVPTLYASSGGEVMNMFSDDVMTLILNKEMGTGTWEMGLGPCETPFLFFSTPKIMDPVSRLPITFGSEYGTVTLQSYGFQYGDRLTGTFDFDVSGDKCLDDECEEEVEITGAITGSFDGVITRYP